MFNRLLQRLNRTSYKKLNRGEDIDHYLMYLFRTPRTKVRLFSTTTILFNNVQNPLKIAFFGSDEFSISSLAQLLQTSQSHKSLISQIDVILRHPKAVNRGLKEIKDVPIADFATANGLNIIRAETKSEINKQLIPNNYDLIIAVSYGKLIPAQLLQAVPYSLNVHPSLLPRYSGASPLQYALLNHDSETGVTVQTLHPTEFDKGDIVDQTPEVGITKDETFVSLRDRLGILGGKLLSDVIINGSFKTPNFRSKYEYSYAGKIHKSLHEIDWNNDTSFTIIRKYNTLGSLFTFKEIKIKPKKKNKPMIHEYRRVIFNNIHEIESDAYKSLQTPGDFTTSSAITSENKIIIKTVDGFISVGQLQLEFEPKEEASKFWQKLPKRAGRETPLTFSGKRII